MSNDKQDQYGHSVEQALLPLGALMVLVVALKYLPPLLVGSVVGLSLVRNRVKPLLAIKTYVWGLATFAIFLFLLFGLPMSNPSLFPGVLGYSDSYWALCLKIAQMWNVHIGRHLKILRVPTLSLLDVTRYVWLSFVAATLFPLGHALAHLFSRNTKKYTPLVKHKRHPAEVLFTLFLTAFFFFWFRYGKRLWVLVHKAPGQLLGVLIPSGLAACPFAFHSSYPDLELFLKVCLLSPLLAVLSGLITAPLSNWIRTIPLRKNGKLPGFLLGTNVSGDPCYLSEANLAHHVELIAPTGSGKTTLLKNLLADRISHGHNIIFMDFKADIELLRWMYRASLSHGRENDLRLFSLADPDLSAPYNPIHSGSYSEIHSQIVNSMTWSDEYYKSFSSRTLLTLLKALCEYRDKTNEPFHLGHILRLLESKEALTTFLAFLTSSHCETAEIIHELSQKLADDKSRQALEGLLSNLSLIVHSTSGEVLTTAVERGAFTLGEALNHPRITYFLMNSLKLRESASMAGKLILQDLMKTIGERYSSATSGPARPLTLIIDEFAEFAIPDFIRILDKARGAGIGIVMAHQSRADLRSISPEFQERIESNSNTTIVSGVKNPDDAEYYAGVLGTQTSEKETIQKKSSFLLPDSETGLKTVREVEEFVLHPNRIKTLHRGEVLVISRTVDPQWHVVNIPLPPEFENYSDTDLDKKLKTIRENYVSESNCKYLALASKLRGKVNAAPITLKTLSSESISADSPKIPRSWQHITRSSIAEAGVHT